MDCGGDRSYVSAPHLSRRRSPAREPLTWEDQEQANYARFTPRENPWPGVPQIEWQGAGGGLPVDVRYSAAGPLGGASGWGAPVGAVPDFYQVSVYLALRC